MAARRYAARHLDSVALLKSMGASQNLVLQISVYELLFLAILAAVVGTALGYIAQEGIYLLLKDLVRGELPPPSFDSAWLGLVVSIAVLTGFALPPLLQLRNTPPARVLRKNAEPPALKYSVVYGLAGGSIFVMLLWLARDVKLVTYVVGGALATVIVLFGAGWLLVKALANFRGGVGVSWRYGLANISRRGPESIVQIMAFGMGLMVLLLLAVVRNDLMSEWQATLKEGSPNHFLINIRPDEAEGVANFFQGLGTERPDMVPMVRARLTHINGTRVEEITTFTNQEEAEDRFDGESNLTWAADLKGDNRLVEGQWWQDGDGGGPRVSIELEVQRDLNLKLGDTVTYDVAGEPVTATVSSVREVQWDSFQPNFFMVFSPGTFDDSAGSYITSVHLDPQQKRSLVDLVRQYPEVTAIDIEAILNQVRVCHGPRVARRAVRVPVHRARGRRGPAGGHPDHSRRTPLRERDAPHAGCQPPHRAARCRGRVLGARAALGRARRHRRHGRGLPACHPGARPAVSLPVRGVAVRSRRGRAARGD